MSEYPYTTQKEVRALFRLMYPNLDYKKIKSHDGKGKMFKTTTRCVFVEFVDDLARSGQISDALASSITL